MANLVAVRSAIRASRVILTASRAERRSTAAGLSAADLARAARSSWAFFASAAALRRSAKPMFLDLFISILYAQTKRLLAYGIDGFRSALPRHIPGHGRDKLEKLAPLSGRVVISEPEYPFNQPLTICG